MSMKFTPEQQQAIDYKGSDLLVSAAAGSGKTAVLVERIINNIRTKYYSVDEIFVATFTKASARDMKQKLENRLRDIILKLEPYSDERMHLEEEVLKLNGAHISTLHSFCMFLIQNHYNVVGLSPDMRTLMEEEKESRISDVLDDILEAWYRSGDEDFLKLERFIATDKVNDPLKREIKKLYETAIATSDPFKFLNELVDQFLDEKRIHKRYEQGKDKYKVEVERTIERVDELMTLYTMAHESEVLAKQHKQFDKLGTLKEQLQELYKNIEADDFVLEKFETLPTRATKLYKDIEDSSIKFRVDGAMNEISMNLKSLASDLPVGKATLEKEMSELNGMNNVLISLAKSLIEGYRSNKARDQVIDFSDYEHFAIQILTANDGEVSDLYKSKFKEVMIDEYQDTNYVQEAIVSLIKTGDESNGNLFMVGDVKQSIYKFRQAAPELFIRKQNRFNNKGTGKVIPLNMNFRSNIGVLETTNFLFEHLMDGDVGEIEYTDAEKLYVGLDENKDIVKTEIVGLVGNKERNIRRTEIELDYVVKEIKALHNNGVKYKDIVLLTRNRKAIDQFNEIFRSHDIPLSYQDTKGYFDTLEIKTCVSLLSIIDNPLQDDKLIGIMRLPFFDFSEDDLAKIRLNSKAHYFYDALFDYMADDDTKEKIDILLDTLTFLVEESRYHTVSGLLSTIFEHFNITEFFAGLPGGDVRRANLFGLVERAIEFERMNHHSLYQFINHVNYLRDKDIDFGEESAISEHEDVVRVMTIHASKGLEFNYVFILNQDYSILGRGLSDKMLVHPDFGMALKSYDEGKGLVTTNLDYDLMYEKLVKERISEEMRLLYVALTRAKTKLFMPFVNILPEADFEEARADKMTYLETFKQPLYQYDDGRKVPADVRLSAKTIEALIIPMLFGSKETFYTARTEYIDEIRHEEEAKKRISFDDLIELNVSYSPQVETRMNYEYVPNEKNKETVKESVSEIKRKNETVPDEAILRNDLFERKVELTKPKFLDQSTDAPLFGTHMHAVMVQVSRRFDSLINLEIKAQTEVVKRIVSHYTEDIPLVTDTMRKRMRDYALKFISDPTIISIFKESKEVHTELPFIMSQKTIGYSDISGKMVQGIVDLLVEHKEHYVLIDYKTDRVKGVPVDELKDRYFTQMDIYQKSLMAALNKPVEVYLYYFNYGVVKVA
ncbi:helicase-exonuclease AddAB subunit AddA [Phocicoccus pinnipedialis]|uniref:DNA 3'-5' helicase n=1 Tax=Phocicoccus pinnipedialis TaxID=110845 RepID=A0A6V7R800_9BACL|nr:helicase-exonuclease AddAB subunit AddA [Jeotgalicoccus pinnipedialis]MBP1938897.1 ATP-dependent helicase/nuclease subunit A [Jeotgalicoccus pinnipedialis]CAD2073263.1 ATP-dependent helicase/nuclease subunit A [Jeotgalicoccus pinnipedialis]